jgi:hypothetical protein
VRVHWRPRSVTRARLGELGYALVNLFRGSYFSRGLFKT